MSKAPPYLSLVNNRSGLTPGPERSRENPELASVREMVDGLDPSRLSAKRLAIAGKKLLHAAYARKPSKSIESVGAWLSDHEDSLRLHEDPYPRMHDLREAVLAAADELDSATGRNGSLWRSTCDEVLGELPAAPLPNTNLTQGSTSNLSLWLTRASSIPNYVWVLGLVGLLGVALGFGLAGVRKGKR